MKDYKFATGKKVHRFCGTCGSSVCIDFLGEWKAAGDVIGINVSLGFFVSLLAFERTISIVVSWRGVLEISLAI